MRISFQMLSQGPLRNMSRSLERYSNLNIKAGSMKNFQKPSDDPNGVRKAMAFDTLIKQNEIYSTNTSSAEMYLDMADSTLLAVKNLVDSARTIALEMRSSTADSGDNVRMSASIEVGGIIDDVMDLMNTRFHNKYIFSGHMVDTPAFERVGGEIQYQGDESSIQLRVGPTRMIDVTVPGSEFLSIGETHRMVSAHMTTMLVSSALLEDLNLGGGVFSGAFRMTNGIGVSSDIDITSCETLDDVIALVNGSGLGIIAGVNTDNGISLYDAAGNGLMTVTELGGGTSAFDLGILGTSIGDTLIGSPLNPQLSEESPVTGVDVMGSIALTGMRITVNGVARDVDFLNPSYPLTVGDVIERINMSVPGVTARLNDTRDGIELISDFEFTVEELGAGTTASDLGLGGASETFEPYSLFGALENLRTALENNDPGALDSIIGQLQYVTDHVLEVEAEVGARGKQVESIKNQLADNRVNLQENLSLIEDVDLSEVLTELAESQVAYEAALQTASTIYNLSLLNYYR